MAETKPTVQQATREPSQLPRVYEVTLTCQVLEYTGMRAIERILSKLINITDMDVTMITARRSTVQAQSWEDMVE